MSLSDLERFSTEIDEKLLNFMDQLELLQEKRASLNALIEQGWFSLSKARYSMGNKQVSSLQYASEIKPLVCVHTQPLDNGEVKFTTNKIHEKFGDLKPVEDIGPQDNGIRRRNKDKHNIDEKAQSEKPIPEQTYEIQKGRKCDHDPEQDSLKWFGILVPQSLKEAQTSFKQVIILSAEIASLQTSILNTRRELWKDMEKKLKLQVTDSPPKGDQEKEG